MQLMEHEGKRLLADAGLAVPSGGVAETAAEAAAVAARLGPKVVVKAQVPTGGRGKAGGILVVDAADAAGAAQRLLGAEVAGHVCSAVLVEEAVADADEVYLGISVDAASRKAVLLLSGEGGVDVESVAASMEAVPIPPGGLRPAEVWRAARAAGIARELVPALCEVALVADRVFREQRAETVEINPLFVSADGTMTVADAHVILDADSSDSAEASTAPEPGSARALGFDLVEIEPDGDVCLITTGAGASMLVVDLLHDAGLRPINFCDLRTGSLRGSSERIEHVIETIGSHPGARVVAVNVFAGITDLEEVATLLLQAIENTRCQLPVVARLLGQGHEQARLRLGAGGIACTDDLDEFVGLVRAEVPDGG